MNSWCRIRLAKAPTEQRGTNTQPADKACAQFHMKDAQVFPQVLSYQKESGTKPSVLRMHESPTHQKGKGDLVSSRTARLNHSLGSWSPGVKASAQPQFQVSSLQCGQRAVCRTLHPRKPQGEQSFTLTHRTNSCNWAPRRSEGGGQRSDGRLSDRHKGGVMLENTEPFIP